MEGVEVVKQLILNFLFMVKTPSTKGMKVSISFCFIVSTFLYIAPERERFLLPMTCDEMLPPICEIACVVVVLTLMEVKSSKDFIST